MINDRFFLSKIIFFAFLDVKNVSKQGKDFVYRRIENGQLENLNLIL